MKYVLVTGVSTGIGLAGARELTAHGYHVFGSVRRQEDGERVRSQLGDNFTPLPFDVTDEAAVRSAVVQVREIIGDSGLAGLVNNSGIAVAGPLMHLSLDEVRYQFEVNVFGVLTVTQAFLPLLGAKKKSPHPPGRILNISSVSGGIAYPFLGPYVGSKHALEAVSHSLRRELLIYGIDVIVIAPGAVNTSIWDKAARLDVGRFAKTDYGSILVDLQRISVEGGKRGLRPEVVGRTIRRALEAIRPKIRYSLTPNPLSGWLIPHLLPNRWLDHLIGKRLGLLKNK